MKICQKLYETGYITYMRTDSKKYSNEFIETALKYIEYKYEEKYVNRSFQCEKEVAIETRVLREEPHEAIRPTDISLEEINSIEEMLYNFTSKEKKIYKIIWQNTIESLMVSSSAYSIEAKITAYDNHSFYYSSELIDFLGWKIVKNKRLPENKEYSYLSNINQEKKIPYKKITSSIAFKDTKSHYTEAKLIHLLEENGIGRPSTFSMIIEKNKERGYVKKEDIRGKIMSCNNYELENNEISEIHIKKEFGNEKDKIILLPLGIQVIKLLEKYFEELFNYNYTKQMEDDLDFIANGVKTKQEVCETYYQKMNQLLNHFYSIEITNEQANENKTTNPNQIKLKKETNPNELLVGSHENKNLYLKKGRFGLYVEWGKNTKSMKKLGNRPLENISLDEILYLLGK